jgi:Restriction endonuclease HincII
MISISSINVNNIDPSNIDFGIKNEVLKQMPVNTFTQRNYLFNLYSKKGNKKNKDLLINNPALHFTLNFKVQDGENHFDEKQDDTADILVVKKGFFEIIDIKTRNLSKTAQAPNIISSLKLAQLCAIMIDTNEFDNLSINYFEIDWLEEESNLVCKDAHFISLFKTQPKNLYINWAAAMQLQFHVCNLDQSFTGNVEQWAKNYLEHFVAQVYKRSEYMIEKYAKPFEKYIAKKG